MQRTVCSRRMSLVSSPSKRKRPAGKRAIKVPPSSPAAKDEGPRLIPLEEVRDSASARVDHYLALADSMLGSKSAPSEIAPPIETIPVPEFVVSPEVEAPATTSPVRSRPKPPKLALPKPPKPPAMPKPPQLSAPKLPLRPPSPRPPRMNVPKPPKRSPHG